VGRTGFLGISKIPVWRDIEGVFPLIKGRIL
jgi:hypothetical protein